MIEYNGQLKDFTWNISRSDKKHRRTKNGTYYEQKIQNIMVLDIEVSSAWMDENKNIFGYYKGESADYWNNLVPLSIPYIWQFSVDDVVYYGRDFHEFINVLNDIPSDCESTIWVHNLSYEWHFLNDFLEWDSLFARTPHKPMYAVPKDYKLITFRCSYFLTNMSLESWGKELGIPKAKGMLDYETLRTPLSKLTDDELFYCKRDCEVVYKGILKYVEEYGTQYDIPMTATGRVRKVIKEMLTDDPDYVKWIKRLVPRDAVEYARLQKVFAGGYTHASRMYSGQIIQGYIEHYDFSSSYPFVMLSEKYPSGKWVYRASLSIPTDEDIERNAYILYLEFKNIKCNTFNTYIQSSKCELVNATFDNGRVLSADVLRIYVTDQDWLTIRDTYKYDSIEVLDSWYCIKKYLPKPFIEYIMKLYYEKTAYKGLSDKAEDYALSKARLNSLYGMSVTNIVQSNVEYSGEEWFMIPLTPADVNERLSKLKSWSPWEKRYFLNYSWGCWITAYARRNLWKCAKSIDFDVLYMDTDSIFCLNKQDFDWYNKECDIKLHKMCDFYDLDFELTRPADTKGIKHPIGYFTKEDNCIEFITLGAKRYCERREDNKLYLTISGINKGAVELLNDDLSNFKDGFVFDKDADCVNKRLHTYIDNMPSVTYPDGYISTWKHGVNMRRNGYELSITDEYKNLIDYKEFNFCNISDKGVNYFKGVF